MSKPDSAMRAAAAAQARETLIGALAADLVGPFDPSLPEERIPMPPSRWYLTGFLAPERRREAVLIGEKDVPVEDMDADEELAAGEDDPKTAADEPKPKRHCLWPASLGISVLLPAGARKITVTVAWADYVPESDEQPQPTDDTPTPVSRLSLRRRWHRMPHTPVSLLVRLDRPGNRVPIEDSRGLEVEYQLQTATSPGLPEGTQALALFVVNRREPIDGRDADQAIAFQVSLRLKHEPGLVARPNLCGERAQDEDDRTADLQYRAQSEWVVGHGVAAQPIEAEDKRVIGASTTWLPRAKVPIVQTKESLADVTLAMETLADLDEPKALGQALAGLSQRYEDWLQDEDKKAQSLTGPRQEQAQVLLCKARRANDRIREGVALLARDQQVRTAFRLANRAMAMQARQRSPEKYDRSKGPCWRPFQLAFILLTLPSIADEKHDDHELVELIFFPTGGGKTEAYLGVAAIILVLRRLRGQARPDKGLGMAVLLRYTLRLLTLDQLGRAATLICALELLRQKDLARLGEVRFSLGLWVGERATPNTIQGAKEKFDDYRASDNPHMAAPCPLSQCPWCGTPFQKNSLEVREAGVHFPEVRLGCASTKGNCPFTLAQDKHGLPVVFVDEQLYRELPGFVIATVDKLAMLPFRGETAALFGRVQAREGKTFLGPLDKAKELKAAEPLPDGLRPPELIIQDELHLISGPLGTMVGLYEAAVDGLCQRMGRDGRVVRAKIIASTATVRRARQQITALFGRSLAPAVFPPPGIDAADSFFGTQETGGHGRLYLGVAAPGRSMKAVLLKVYVALLTAAQRLADTGADGPAVADAYMTLVGYFNSLRELGGMRRLVEDEVQRLCKKIGRRVPCDYPNPNPWFAPRTLAVDPLELTSRESTQQITEAKARLAECHESERAVDVALASNMISVGVDVSRLGLMVVAGQPKSTSEYIQATSRVGREREKPGLVVVVFNLHKPRDRSHFEHFQSYHEAFYRNVEATSVTPFSGPALERGLAGTLVALTRLGTSALIPPAAAARLEEHKDWRDQVIKQLAERAATVGGMDSPPAEAEKWARAIEKSAKALFDSWDRIVAASNKDGVPRVYSTFDVGCSKKPSLLLTPLDESQRRGADEERFIAPTSMRDVEAPVHLWIVKGKLGRGEAPDGEK
jgi:hypothetical protein